MITASSLGALELDHPSRGGSSTSTFAQLGNKKNILYQSLGKSGSLRPAFFLVKIFFAFVF